MKLPRKHPNGPRVLSLANMKGGVGKSTVAMALCEMLALRHNQRVLAVDLDPQANLSIMFLGAVAVDELKRDALTINRAMELMAAGEVPTATHFIRPRVSDLAPLQSRDRGTGRVDLVPAAAGVRFAEMRLEFRMAKGAESLAEARGAAEHQMTEFLSPALQNFDAVVFDCPPALSLVAQAAIAMSDLTITPVIPDEVNAISTANFIDNIAHPSDPDFSMTEPTRVRVLFSKYRRTALADRAMERIRRGVGGALTHTVRLSDALAKAGLRPTRRGTRTPSQKYGTELERITRLAGEIAETIGVQPHVG